MTVRAKLPWSRGRTSPPARRMQAKVDDKQQAMMMRDYNRSDAAKEGAGLAEWERVPPPVAEFIESGEYLGLGAETCQAVKRTLADLTAGGHVEAALAWGIGAGKSYLCSVALAYLAYRTLCLADPQATYGLAPGTQIVLANFSVNATQAQRVVFHETRERVDRAECFKRPPFLRDQRLTSELRWPAKGLSVVPGNSLDTSALGLNLLGAVIDEAAWLPVVEGSVRQAGRAYGEKYDAAEELYNTVTKRMRSRGNERWRADCLLLMISAPRFSFDFLERKFAEARDNPAVFASRLPAWEGALRAGLSGATFDDAVCGAVPVEFADQFQRNPELARRDLGAVPSEAVGRYLNPAAVFDAVDVGRASPTLLFAPLPVAWRGKPDCQYYLHVDLGLRRDAAGAALAHWEAGGVVVDWAQRLSGQDFPDREVDFDALVDLVDDLYRVGGFALMGVTYDGWQSEHSLQRLRARGHRTGVLSVDRTLAPYETLKELVNTGAVRLPDYGPLKLELTELMLLEGKRVDHPPHGSKDVADAVAGAVYGAHQAGAQAFGFGFAGEGVSAPTPPQPVTVEEPSRPVSGDIGPIIPETLFPT